MTRTVLTFLRTPILYFDRLRHYQISDDEPHLLYGASLFLTLLLILCVYVVNRVGRLRPLLCATIPCVTVGSPLYLYESMSELAGGPLLDLWIPWTEMAVVLAFTLFLFFRRAPWIVLGTLVGSIAHFVFWNWATFGPPRHISDYLYPPPVLLPCSGLAIWALYVKRSHAEVRA